VTASYDNTARVWDARTGQPLAEPLRHAGFLLSAQFSPDGQWVVTASDDNTARVWDEPRPVVPVPLWFLDWAEAIAGRRLTAQGIDVAVPTTESLQRQEQVATRTDTDFFARLAKWVQANPATRSISPNSPITVPEYVARRIQENTIASLREVIQLSPTNAVAFARLAALVKDQDPKQNPGRLEEAEFYARYALKHDPDNAEAKQTLEALKSPKSQ
jgi:hypothetical protein